MPKSTKSSRQRRMCNYDIRVWVCEGHRPVHDSVPLCSGVILSEHEYHTLRNMIARYYGKCAERRQKEAPK
jgi:hypothetical protein